MKGSAQKFLNKAIGNNGRPLVINIDKSGANPCPIRTVNASIFSRIRRRSCKYLNNIMEQDHRKLSSDEKIRIVLEGLQGEELV